MKSLVVILVISCLTSCTPAVMKCLRAVIGLEKEYSYDRPKQELKDDLLQAFTYDKGGWHTIFGGYSVTNQQIDSKYRVTWEQWLGKDEWPAMKRQIRSELKDTMTLTITKGVNARHITMYVEVMGNEKESSIVIDDIMYARQRECSETNDSTWEATKTKVEKRIRKALLDKLRK